MTVTAALDVSPYNIAMTSDPVAMNVGRVDMLMRFGMAAVLFSANAVLDEGQRWVAVAGFLPLMTGLFRFCPLYDLLGVRTCGAELRK
ncbi:YgaP family membrane protein [Terriglobus roseus]|uniref:Inner membrane protein YgaP-like transmembrane domain-containing protein n=1 Tax=Terriglobus roseus TaxID=392734 RepID=A0A1H4PPP8_9BACT|nr:DUF2892 domain-containing protein [Terriglobus roseus]SEC09443.1 Protein of unknown function [Terriglobus roseus]